MEFYEMSFFGQPVKAVMEKNIDYSHYQFSIVLNSTGKRFDRPQIRFYIEDEKDFIAFKNSVISSYENYKRKQKELNK